MMHLVADVLHMLYKMSLYLNSFTRSYFIFKQSTSAFTACRFTGLMSLDMVKNNTFFSLTEALMSEKTLNLEGKSATVLISGEKGRNILLLIS